MKKLLIAALGALLVWGAPAAAVAQIATGYQAQVNNRTVTVPDTAANPHPVTCVSGCSASGSIVADTTPFLNMTTATTTKIVTGTSGKKTYITHLRFMANGATTFKLVSGTGTNCATGTADLTETWDLTAQVGAAFGGAGPVVIAPTAADVCGVNSAAVNLRFGLAETQQ